jgi:hypothetical protein
LGFGVWGFGFGVLGPTPNPQSPIPNPQSFYNIKIIIFNLINLIILLYINKLFLIMKL